MKLKSFKIFIESQQADPELKKRVEKQLSLKDGECPRCGMKESECECKDKDYASTVNAYRLRKGTIKSKT